MNKYSELAQKWFRGVYGNDPLVVDKLGSDDVLITYPIFKKLFDTFVLQGKPKVKQFANGFRERWKETEVTFHESIEQGAQVVLVWSFRGKNVGSAVENVESTNEFHCWGGITLIRFDADGKITAEIGEESEPGPYGRLKETGK